MLCSVAIVAVHYTHINTYYVVLLLLLYTTHINTCYVVLLLLAVHYTYINTHYVVLLLLAVHYTYINTHYVVLLLLTVHYTHINTHYVVLLLLAVSMYTMLSKISENIPYLVAIVDYTCMGSAIASVEDLVTLHRRTLVVDVYASYTEKQLNDEFHGGGGGRGGSHRNIVCDAGLP